MTPTDEQLAALAAAFDTFARRYKLAETVRTGSPLNELDKQALLYVADHSGCGPTDVARHLGIANTTVSSAIDRLARKGLLDRARPEIDRRAVSLSLSKAGEERAATYYAAHRELYRSLLAPLTTTDQEQLIRIMTIIAQYET